MMSSCLIVYLNLYTAPGLNDRRFGRRMRIVTHVDIGRQDYSDSNWRNVSKRVVIWDEPRLHVNMPRRGHPEHAISVQNLRRRFTPTQVNFVGLAG